MPLFERMPLLQLLTTTGSALPSLPRRLGPLTAGLKGPGRGAALIWRGRAARTRRPGM